MLFGRKDGSRYGYLRGGKRRNRTSKCRHPYLRKKRIKSKRGVPSGYNHKWAYRGMWNETKQPDGTWKVDFRATKGKKARGYGQFKKGFKIKWKIDGIQTAVKTGKGQYQTRLTAKKRRLKSGYNI